MTRIILASIGVWLAVAYATDNSAAMQACQHTHSGGVCHATLR